MTKQNKRRPVPTLAGASKAEAREIEKQAREVEAWLQREFVAYRETVKDSSQSVPYTKGQHCAIRHLFTQIAIELAGMELAARTQRRSFEARVAALETRLVEIENGKQANSRMGWAGIWEAEKEYPAGAFVTFDGSMWHADVASRGGRPGTAAGWTLCVKRGRDGRNVGEAVRRQIENAQVPARR